MDVREIATMDVAEAAPMDAKAHVKGIAQVPAHLDVMVLLHYFSKWITNLTKTNHHQAGPSQSPSLSPKTISLPANIATS